MPADMKYDKTGFSRKRRRGFSLIVVLIIAIIGLAVIGASVQMTMSSGGMGRMSSASVTTYNFLQDAVEEGKAILKKNMDNTSPPPRYAGYTTPKEVKDILTSGHLILSGDQYNISRTLSKQDLGRLGISGNGGNLNVRIYDMQYLPEKVPPVGTLMGEITPKELHLIPPSVVVSGRNRSQSLITTPNFKKPTKPGRGSGSSNNTGVYLVRATLDVGGGKSWTLESAIIQSNSM